MRYLSLFSGIEAATAAWHELGWTCVAVAEIETVPCRILAHHYPDVPNLGDVTKITEEQIAALGLIDLIVFGSPCQDLSVAGNRKGFVDVLGDLTRSGLFHVAIRIIGWARKHCKLRFALWENVPGAFSSNKGRDFAVVVAQLAGLDHIDPPPSGWGTEGCAVGDFGLVEWSTLDAQWFGVAQRRRRVFAFADFGDWVRRPPVLLEPESLRGNSAPSRETGQTVTHDVAPCLTSSGRGIERAGDTRGQDAAVACRGGRPFLNGAGPGLAFGGNNTSGPIDVSTAVNAKATQRQDFETETETFVVGALCSNGKAAGSATQQDAESGYLIAVPHVDVVPTMLAASSTAAGHGARSCDTKDSYIVPVRAVASTLGQRMRGQDDSCADNLQVVAFQTRGTNLDTNGEISGTLGTNGGSASGCAPCVAVTGNISHALNTANNGKGCSEDGTGRGVPTIAFQERGREGGRSLEIGGDLAFALTAPNGGGRAQERNILSGWQVRRLTPRECERLQDFEDDYTNILHRGKPVADGPRYKALGNSMCRAVMLWIGRRIDVIGLFQ